MGEYYGISVEILCKLMQFNGQDGMIEVNKLGGVEEICEKLGTSPTEGVGNSTLEHRRATFGNNDIPKETGVSFLRLLWNVLSDPTVVLILCSVLVYLVYGISLSWFCHAGCVVIVVLVTLIVNVLYERRFQRILDDSNVKDEVTVIRNAIVNKINVEGIVVGDVCLIDNGDVVSADGILIECNGLIVDESSQTGSSGSANKSVHLDPMLFSGTKVVDGSGTMIVVAVGVNTRKGAISSLLMTNGVTNKGPQTIKFTNEISIIQQKVLRLFWNIIHVLLIFSAILFVVQATQFTVHKFIIERQSWRSYYIQRYVQIFLSWIFLILNVLPYAIPLPLTVTIVLALTAKKLFGDNKLVRSLHSSETMGNVTSICFDKTGTLTTNRIEIVHSYIGENEYAWDSDNEKPKLSKNTLNLIAENISINSSVSSVVKYCKDNIVEQTGNRTECALLGLVNKLGLDFQSIRETYSDQSIHIVPFNSNRKLMGTVIRISDGGYRLYVKGASDNVLSKCKFVIGQNDKLMEMTNNLRDHITLEVIKPVTSNRLRTISLAYRDFVVQRTAVNETLITGETDWTDETNLVKNLTFLGVFGIADPIRPEVPELVNHLHTAGITLRMITGDDINTAISVATQCGIISESSADIALDGTEFNKRIRDSDGVIKQNLFDNVYPTLRVLARASPMDKYNLVNGIIQSTTNNRSEIVAMIGDGDSDAFALKRADVGITFNQIGQDIAKNASDIILKDNQIGSIINAVLWGRHAYESIAKFIQFMLHAKLASLMILVLTMDNFDPQFFNSDILCLIVALASVFFYDPIQDVDQSKPYGRHEHLLSKNMIINIIGQSIYQIIAFYTNKYCHENFASDTECLRYNIRQFMCNTFVLVSLFAMLNARSLHGERNVFRKIRSNFSFIAIWIFAFVIQIVVLIVDISFFARCEPSTLAMLWGVGFFLGVGILTWQQLLFLCNRTRKVKKNDSEVNV